MLKKILILLIVLLSLDVSAFSEEIQKPVVAGSFYPAERIIGEIAFSE